MKKVITTICLLVLVIFALSQLPVKEWLTQLLGWFEAFGSLAPVVYLFFFALCAPHIFPVFLLSIGAGMLFGTFKGFVISSIANLLTCYAMFLLARYVGRGWFEKKLMKNDYVKNINCAIENEGWRMLFMLRAVPVVHMIVLNIACGLSKVKVKDYLIGTWLGMIPMLFVYSYMGSVSDNIMEASSSSLLQGSQVWFMVLVIPVLIGFSIYMRTIMKKYMVPVTISG